MAVAEGWVEWGAGVAEGAVVAGMPMALLPSPAKTSPSVNSRIEERTFNLNSLFK